MTEIQCTRCGIPIQRKATGKPPKYCPECRRKMGSGWAKAWRDKVDKPDVHKPAKPMTLAEVTRRAREAGMSYGKYVEMQRRNG